MKSNLNTGGDKKSIYNWSRKKFYSILFIISILIPKITVGISFILFDKSISGLDILDIMIPTLFITIILVVIANVKILSIYENKRMIKDGDVYQHISKALYFIFIIIISFILALA